MFCFLEIQVTVFSPLRDVRWKSGKL